MTCVFQVNSGPDLATAEEAISIAEQKDSASVVKFNLERNMPDRLPKFVHRSCGLWSFEKIVLRSGNPTTSMMDVGIRWVKSSPINFLAEIGTIRL